jgi:hypothetical protein
VTPGVPASKRLVLSADELAVLAADLPEGARLPPGVAPGPPGDGAAARTSLEARGLRPGGRAHPALLDDLLRLAAPEVAVLLEVACPVADARAAVVVRGALGAALVRVGDGVELSAFAAPALAVELARTVPPPTGAPLAKRVVPLAALVSPGSPAAASLHARVDGSLRAVVVGAGGRSAGVVDWAWLRSGGGSGGGAGGWAALEPVAGGSAPEVRVVPVGPDDLARAVAPSVALLLADDRAAAP